LLPKTGKFASCCRILFFFLCRLHDLHLTKTAAAATAATTAQTAMSRLTLDTYCYGVDDSDDDRGHDDYGLDDGDNQPEDDFDDFIRLRPRQASLHTSHLFFLMILLELIPSIA
jgi:hypothetical protein